ncbi:MAG: alanine--glyoxylate aminotransferase family protein, partial [Candidatus Zipacnadales bacterium]
GLRLALALMAAEGLPNIYARHRRLGAKLRQGLKSLGLELLADEAHASDTLTGVYIPPDFDPEEWLQRLEDEHGVVVSGGLGPLKGKIFRIAHMGYVHDSDIEGVLAALEALLCAGPRGR